jgi:spore coat protein U-like protein
MKKQSRKSKALTVTTAALGVLLNTASIGFAAQANDSFDIKLKVIEGCRISVADVDFGEVDTVVQGTIVDAQVTAYCTQDTRIRITLDPTGVDTDRVETGNLTGAIVGNTDTIPYRLNLQGILNTRGQGLNTAIIRNIRGRITGNVNARPDTYSAQNTIYMFF